MTNYTIKHPLCIRANDASVHANRVLNRSGLCRKQVIPVYKHGNAQKVYPLAKVKYKE